MPLMIHSIPAMALSRDLYPFPCNPCTDASISADMKQSKTNSTAVAMLQHTDLYNPPKSTSLL
jgi:hypothetical protein